MNLAEYSSQELRNLRKEVERELKKRRKQEAKEAQRELKSVAERYGFSLSDLVAQAGAKAGSTAKGGARYRHPQDPDKTWSGRGRKPGWIKEWEAAGRPLDELRID